MDSYPINTLPPRERAVAALLSAGLTNVEIGRRLALVPDDVADLIERIGLGLIPSWGAGAGARYAGCRPHPEPTVDTTLTVLPFPEKAQEGDVLLDGWLASLTPDQFARILDSLARPRIERRAAAS